MLRLSKNTKGRVAPAFLFAVHAVALQPGADLHFQDAIHGHTTSDVRAIAQNKSFNSPIEKDTRAKLLGFVRHGTRPGKKETFSLKIAIMSGPYAGKKTWVFLDLNNPALRLFDKADNDKPLSERTVTTEPEDAGSALTLREIQPETPIVPINQAEEPSLLGPAAIQPETELSQALELFFSAPLEDLLPQQVKCGNDPQGAAESTAQSDDALNAQWIAEISKKAASRDNPDTRDPGDESPEQAGRSRLIQTSTVSKAEETHIPPQLPQDVTPHIPPQLPEVPSGLDTTAAAIKRALLDPASVVPPQIQSATRPELKPQPKPEARVETPPADSSGWWTKITNPLPVRGQLFQLSADTTKNSSIKLDGNVPPGTSRIMAQISRTGSPESMVRETIDLESASVSQKIYLRKGPGDYTVQLFLCKPGEKTCSHADEFKVKNTDPSDRSYLLPSTRFQSDDPDIIAKAREITAGASTDREKSRLIHDWVAKNVSYDAERLIDGTYNEASFAATSILRTLKSVCHGYSSLNVALHRAVGIRARIVEGRVVSKDENGMTMVSDDKSGLPNHSWNEVLIDGQWLPQDTTWDSGYVDRVNKRFVREFKTKYFEMTPQKFAESHVKMSERED